MINKEISIIMPIYNTEKYLKKSIQSILSQTFKNFELILINDGSTDNSKNICEEFKSIDNRVIVINKENSGSSLSRNIGIDIAKGKYICFVDSDDWIEYEMIYENYKLAETYNTDIVISGMYIDRISDKQIKVSSINNYKFSIWNSPDKIHSNIIELFPNALINSSCNKLYKLETIKKIGARFPNTNIGEDTLFNLEVIKYSKSIVVNDKPYYHYMRYENNKTLTSRVIEDAYQQYIDIHKKMNSLFGYWQISNNYIEEKINQTMFAQYFATTMKIINSDKKIYSYRMKKNMLDRGLKKSIISNTFDYSKPYSYKERIFRFTIRHRLYSMTMILLKLQNIKLLIDKIFAF